MSATIRGLLVPADDTAVRVVTAGEYELADTINADYVEYVRTPLDGVTMIVDEEGLITGRRFNRHVSGRLHNMIVGDVLVLGEMLAADGGLDVTDLTDEQLVVVCGVLGIDVPEGVSA